VLTQEIYQLHSPTSTGTKLLNLQHTSGGHRTAGRRPRLLGSPSLLTSARSALRCSSMVASHASRKSSSSMSSRSCSTGCRSERQLGGAAPGRPAVTHTVLSNTGATLCPSAGPCVPWTSSLPADSTCKWPAGKPGCVQRSNAASGSLVCVNAARGMLDPTEIRSERNTRTTLSAQRGVLHAEGSSSEWRTGCVRSVAAIVLVSASTGDACCCCWLVSAGRAGAVARRGALN
jgi:hypothetical protein